ncbi:hypothetical protein [Fischerella sp. PCC 9605]|uniref:hypothetical protein n=1 Tax=Fischerella sp. PCC 9605 TaxID=1173024 RepID=UPI0004AF5985|nr:hypothetical protein [Fischerella sp. PCC 9605]
MTQKAVAVTRVHWRSTKPFKLKFSSGTRAIASRFVAPGCLDRYEAGAVRDIQKIKCPAVLNIFLLIPRI